MKNAVGSLIGIALNLWIALGSILIFTILILPIHEHGIFLHLLGQTDSYPLYHQGSPCLAFY